jgi:hypothetical protein
MYGTTTCRPSYLQNITLFFRRKVKEFIRLYMSEQPERNNIVDAFRRERQFPTVGNQEGDILVAIAAFAACAQTIDLSAAINCVQ